MATVRTEQSEMDIFVKEKPQVALEYLKLLKEELTKTNHSRNWYTYLTWLLIVTFYLLNTDSAQIQILIFEKIDPSLLLKLLPAVTVASYYAMVTRFFIFKERVAIFDEVASRLFPSESYPFSSYLVPTHFMLSERLLNRYCHRDEILGNNTMLVLIALATIYSPVVFAIYEYVIVISHYGFNDTAVVVSIIIGIVFVTQSIVVERGRHITSSKIHPDSSIKKH